MCIDSHSSQSTKHELTKSQDQMVAKIAAFINSVAQLLVIQNQENYEKSSNGCESRKSFS